MTPWLRRRLLALLRLRERAPSREFDMSSAAESIDPDSVPTPVVGPPNDPAFPDASGKPTVPGRRSSRPPRKRLQR